VFEAGAEQPTGGGSEAEQPTGGGSEEVAGVVQDDLDSLLEDTKRERDEYLDLAQRARADFENYRKRAAADVSAAERRGRAALAKDLVPTIDNLERALRSAGIDLDRAAPAAAGEPASEEVSARDALAHGVELVYRELKGALSRSGVEAYDPAGEAFDPSVHEAIATQPSEGTVQGTVLETVDKGYRLDGQVLRAARVIVAE
jgi:molecular chaperone GrpE